jgi:hybrid cluster-associated redox disulfide protein
LRQRNDAAGNCCYAGSIIGRFAWDLMRNRMVRMMNERESSINRPELTAALTVQELLDRWPETAQVFIRHQMGCVGCAMAPFDSLSDAAAVYHLSVDEFLVELRRACRR